MVEWLRGIIRETEEYKLAFVLKVIYCICLIVINISMLTQYITSEARMLTMIFSLVMFATLFVKNKYYKVFYVLGSLGLFLFINLNYPVVLSQVEEAYIVLPVMILCLYPGKLYSNFAAILVAFIYYDAAHLKNGFELIEDTSELILFNLILSVLLMYFMKFIDKINRYRKDSYTDVLTGLSNRKAFISSVNHISKKSYPKFKYALLIFDINGFKKLNDTLGYDVGDRVLIDLSKRLAKMESKSLSLYRFGGDEFSAVIQGDRDYVLSRIVDLKEAISKPFVYDELNVTIDVRFGYITNNDENNSSVELIKKCDLALSQAKKNTRDFIVEYDKSMSNEIEMLYELDRDIKKALDKEELHIEYQPKVSMLDGSVNDSEALLRWTHPKYGAIRPIDFIRIAEKNGCIVEIGKWVVDQVCHQIEVWTHLGYRQKVSINISFVQLNNDDLYTYLKDKISEYSIESSLIEIEITETAIMKNPDHVIDHLIKIKSLGVTIAIDDFGVEYSSFNYLRQLPIDTLKVDKDFIQNCQNDKKDLMILKGIIQLGNNLELNVIAEGVEESSQKDLVKSAACNYIQGYYFSKPLKIKEFNALLLNEVTFDL